MQQNKCGLCGKRGHNKRTCGKNFTRPSSAASHPPVTQTPPPARPLTDIFAPETFPPRPKNVPAVENIGLSVHDIDVWWLLQHGQVENSFNAAPNDIVEVMEYSICLTGFLADLEKAGVGERARKNFFLLKTRQHVSLKREVANLPGCPHYLMDMLSYENDISTVENVAGNARCPTSISDRLVTHKSQRVRAAVAETGQLSAASFELLSHDMSEHVLTMLSRNPNTPAHILHRIAQKRLWDAQWFIAVNPSASEETLAMLVTDFSDLRDLPVDYGKTVLRVAERDDLSEKVFAELVRVCRTPVSSRPADRFASRNIATTMSANAFLPSRFVSDLAESPDSFIRSVAARDFRVSDKVLRELVTDDDPDVASAARACLQVRENRR